MDERERQARADLAKRGILPGVTYADHSYPAYSGIQLLAALESRPAPTEECTCEHDPLCPLNHPATETQPVAGGERQPPAPIEQFDPKRFGESVRSLLAQRSLSFRNAAVEVGVSSATLNRIARGCMPDVPSYLAVMRWLGAAPERAKAIEEARYAESVEALQIVRNNAIEDCARIAENWCKPGFELTYRTLPDAIRALSASPPEVGESQD